MTTWRVVIEAALRELGGEARLKEIYDAIQIRRSGTLSENWRATVRRELEQNSSDTESHRGLRDIFYSVEGIGGGVWGLRELKPTAAEQASRDLANIFISYRRDDSAGHAGRIHDRLEREFGRDPLFMDVDAIPLGSDFVKVLSAEVDKCGVLLAVIGPGWLGARDVDGQRRLDNDSDFVRVEISSALRRDIPLIPILLDGARVPKADQLPEEMRGLSRRHGLEVRHASFHADMDKLVNALRATRPAFAPRQGTGHLPPVNVANAPQAVHLVKQHLKDWWKPVLDMKLDDPDQETPYWVGTNNVILNTPFPGVQIKAFASVDKTTMEVFVSGRSRSEVEAVAGFIQRERRELEQALPPGTVIDPRERWPIGTRREDIRDDDERRSWIIATLNIYAKVLRPRFSIWFASTSLNK